MQTNQIIKVHFEDERPNPTGILAATPIANWPARLALTRLVEASTGWFLIHDELVPARDAFWRSLYLLEAATAEGLVAERNAENKGWLKEDFDLSAWLRKQPGVTRIGNLNVHGEFTFLLGADPSRLIPPMTEAADKTLWWFLMQDRHEGPQWCPARLTFRPANSLGGKEEAKFYVKAFTEHGGVTSFTLTATEVHAETWGGPVAGPRLE